MQDRRRCARWQATRMTRMKLEGKQEYVECNLNDINFKGLQISCLEKLPLDTNLKLNIAISQDFYLNVEAWVAWHRCVDKYNVYGMYFTRIKDSDKEKIYKFIRNDFPEEIRKKWWEMPIEGGDNMQNLNFEDRRIFARFPVKFSLKFMGHNNSQEGLGTACDISAKGIGLVTEKELKPKTPLEIWLDIPDRGEPLYTRGEVVWSQMVESNIYKAGINLDKADLMGVARALRVS